MVGTKKAFTVMELIFVMLIIGILTTILLPRLTATRDDAKVAVALSDVGRLVSEITIYYTTYGYFDGNLSNMTSVSDSKYTTAWDTLAEEGIVTYYTPKNTTGLEACLTLSLKNQDGHIALSNANGSHENVCSGLQSVQTYKNLLTTKFLLGNNIF